MVARVQVRERAHAEKRAAGNYFIDEKKDVDFITSGSKVLDLALGGGWARGRVANVVGDKSTGKTLLCIEASANFVAKVGKKARVRHREIESAFDVGYAKALGFPTSQVDRASMDTVEELWADLEAIVKGARGPELVIVDSLDALSDAAEMERGMDEASYGAAKAKQLSQLFRRLVRKLEDKDVTLLIVSQIRDKIGVSFGRKYSRSGGRALDFYASQVMMLAHLGHLNRTVKGSKRSIGVNIRANMDKNKIALPQRQAQFPILFGWGVDDIASCLNFLKETKGLKEAGYKSNMTDVDILLTSRDLMNGPREEYLEEQTHLHKMVDVRWRDIERTLMPKRSKYGN